MKVPLTSPAFLHIDLCFDGHVCKSIVFDCEMSVFCYRIFAMVLRHVCSLQIRVFSVDCSVYEARM